MSSRSSSSSFIITPVFRHKFGANTYLPPNIHFTIHKPRKSTIFCTNSQNQQQQQQQQQQQLNLSVLRFTLGIPGLDESNLPKWIGYAFGSLLLLNHFVGSDSNTITSAQLRTEVLGLSLSAFSVVVPFLGKFLKGASPVDQAILPGGSEQFFVMSENISNTLKEDLAWGTYILLRNTNSVSVLILAQNALCVRGYWNAPEGISKNNALDWFEKQVQQLGFSNLKETLYFSQNTDSNLWKILPKETRSLLVHPILLDEKTKGFLLLASSISYAYNNRDRAWIGAIANKYRGNLYVKGVRIHNYFLDNGLSCTLPQVLVQRFTDGENSNFFRNFSKQ